MKLNLIVALVIALVGVQSYAKNLKCNRSQTFCTTVNKDLVVGDKIGIFNGDDNLVAVGKVSKMRGKKRTVKIGKTHDVIKKSHRLVLLENSVMNENYRDSYAVVTKPSKKAVGGHFGFSSIGIGDSSPATVISGFGQMRRWRNVQIVARGTWISAEGQVSRLNDDGYEIGNISMNGVGALGGASYTLFEQKSISFRGEAGVGFMYLMASVDGDSGDVSGAGYTTNVDNGFGKYLRTSASALYNMNIWHIEAAASFAYVHDALAKTIYAGVIRDIK